ncbi:hypothetical protein D9M68_239320 [compost metagenome]
MIWSRARRRRSRRRMKFALRDAAGRHESQKGRERALSVDVSYHGNGHFRLSLERLLDAMVVRCIRTSP